jgi:hypothetical protein
MTTFTGQIITLPSIKHALASLESGWFLIVIDADPESIGAWCNNIRKKLGRRFSYSIFRGGVKVKRVL